MPTKVASDAKMVAMPNLPESTAPCPCGGDVFAECCGPLLSGESRAWTAEALMRSRFTAFAVDDTDYIWRTWHPRTRPAKVLPSGNQWLSLSIVDTVDGMPGDQTGVVEFEATYRDSWRTKVQHERSLFEYRASRWLYVDAM